MQVCLLETPSVSYCIMERNILAAKRCLCFLFLGSLLFMPVAPILAQTGKYTGGN
jgi:hypothetical protein